ncbi:MAG: hypothetical protein ACFFCS_02615 [Candidatus Hodarchaeota archaeon]
MSSYKIARMQERSELIKFAWILISGMLKDRRTTARIPEVFLDVLRLVPKLMKIVLAPRRAFQFKTYPKDGMVPDKDNPRPGADPYAFEPFEENFEDRQATFLKLLARRNKGGLIGEAARSLLGEDAKVSEKSIKLYVDRLESRLDCTDFYALQLILSLYIHERKPFLTDSQHERLKNAILGFKFWIDEPGPHKTIFYTENHQIVFHVVEYLTGAMFPDEIFPNNEKDGKWHREHAKQLLLAWMKNRARFGYDEWASNVYFSLDLQALASLAEFAVEEDVAKAAAISTDLLLFLIACDLFRGFHAATKGRAYADDILSGRDYEVAPAVKVVWGLGTFALQGNVAALAFATARRYRPSEIIFKMGQEQPREFYSKERIGFWLKDARKHGFSPRRLEDAVFLWGMGGFSNPEIVDLLFHACDTWNMWNEPFFEYIGKLHLLIPRTRNLGEFTKKFEIETNRTILGEVHKVTYRTKDYMLSTAQDYRKGGRGNQHHIWQATLSPDAVVFTKNPGYLLYGLKRNQLDLSDFKIGASATSAASGLQFANVRPPNYWAGENRFPRAAQYKNLVIAIYNINFKKAIGERAVYDFTHAFFPRWAFDAVEEHEGWIFGKRGNGYIGLFSAFPPQWNDPDSPFCHDVVAWNGTNTWICMLGNDKQYGSFEDFIRLVYTSPLRVSSSNLKVEFDAPSIGKVEFSWSGPFLVDGTEISLRHEKRVDNPWCTVDFNTTRYEINYKGRKLLLDLDTLERKES